MTRLENYVGQVLDDKYRLERLLGQGGMGAVYLATHLGTERYVALKLIAPQFMRNEEFVERFKREARAAGRLRHPNVVDVTDFGFARTGNERVAYLVMEYLDGCTLSDVLAEEKRLPLYWVADILEQVCSAVHEAHQQGIVHRDLKPDNIWLEPNRLGSYRVKVLDFGIAKLAEGDMSDMPVTMPRPLALTIPSFSEDSESDTIHFSDLSGLAVEAEAPTLIGGKPEIAGKSVPSDAVRDDDSDGTRLFSAVAATRAFARSENTVGDIAGGDQTRMFDEETANTPMAARGVTQLQQDSTSGLTRVGAIMGTPTYMSPEQCRGEVLDARSDIYSLGVIAYQMLAGAPPFSGDMTTVMRAHIETTPKNLREHTPKLRKRVARVIGAAMAKNPAERPQSAAAFANSLRANADNLGALYRRAFALYSEYFPKFVTLSLVAHIPVIILTVALVVVQAFEQRLGRITTILISLPLGLLQFVATFITASVISGVTAIIVTQLAVAPLKPVELRAAIHVMRQRIRPFFRTAVRITLRILLGWCLFLIPGFVMSVRYLLWAPVVLMEGLEKKAARLRARSLGSRSWRTMIAVVVIQFMVPILINAALGAVAALLASAAKKTGHDSVQIKVGSQFSSLINILILPLMSIVPALLYLKMRQLGGETLNDIMEQIEQVEPVRSNWQQRMRTRLSMHTPHTTHTHKSGA